MSMPAVFVSHGSPMLPFERHGAVPFLRALGCSLPRPRAIAVISAHWEARIPTVSLSERPRTLHDFAGFPDPLYQLRYPVPGAAEVALRAFALMRAALPAVCQRQDRGLDHGAWVPLLLIYPEAEIPSFQISIQPDQGPAGAYAMGRALAPLREEGVLILGSGAIVHNLQLLGREGAPTPTWASAFDDWVTARIKADDEAALTHYRSLAPAAELAHPRDEHLLPLFAVHGTANGAPARALYRGFSHASISMTAFGFGMGSA